MGEQMKVEHPEEYQWALLEIKSQEEARARAKMEETSHAQTMSALTAGKQGARLLLTTRRNGLRKKGRVVSNVRWDLLRALKTIDKHASFMCKRNTVRGFDKRATYAGHVSLLYAATYRTTLERQLDELGTKSSRLADGGFGCASNYPSSDAGCPQSHPHCKGYVDKAQWGKCSKYKFSSVLMNNIGCNILKDGEACQPHCDAYDDFYINDLEFTDKENNDKKHEPKGSVSCNKGRYEWKDFSCARVLEPCNAA